MPHNAQKRRLLQGGNTTIAALLTHEIGNAIAPERGALVIIFDRVESHGSAGYASSCGLDQTVAVLAQLLEHLRQKQAAGEGGACAPRTN
jgi:hypothetical protein